MTVSTLEAGPYMQQKHFPLLNRHKKNFTWHSVLFVSKERLYISGSKLATATVAALNLRQKIGSDWSPSIEMLFEPSM